MDILLSGVFEEGSTLCDFLSKSNVSSLKLSVITMLHCSHKKQAALKTLKIGNYGLSTFGKFQLKY